MNAMIVSWYSEKSQPFKRQPHKMAKHTQTIRRLLADELFECVWLFRAVGAYIVWPFLMHEKVVSSP